MRKNYFGVSLLTLLIVVAIIGVAVILEQNDLGVYLGPRISGGKNPPPTGIFGKDGPFFTDEPGLTPTCVQPPEGMVSWWDGTQLEDDDICFVDDIMDGNVGVCWNTAETEFFSANGYVGDGYYFNDYDSWIQISDSDNLDVTSITIDAWVFAQDPIGDGWPVVYKEGSFGLFVDDGNEVICGIATLDNPEQDYNVGSTLTSNTWTHIACTYDENVGVIKLFVNGVHVAGLLTETNAMFVSSGNLFIGGVPSGGFFVGLIDEVEIFNRALSQSEIQDIYNAGSAGKCKPGSETYWRVFVSSTADSGGEIQGLSSADAACQFAANQAGLGGTWKAWLSDSTTSASQRLHHSTIPYKLLDGAQIADDWNDLTDGSLQNIINIDQTGQELGVLDNNAVWTGTFADGTGAGDYCNDWTSSSSSDLGIVGIFTLSTDSWSWEVPYPCDQIAHLYCFEQPDETPTGCTVDEDCQDDLFCNGEETCNTDTNLCESGTNPCPNTVCSESDDSCIIGDPPPPCNTCGSGEFCDAEICEGQGNCFYIGPEEGGGICRDAGPQDNVPV
jgi:hypothetical protein